MFAVFGKGIGAVRVTVRVWDRVPLCLPSAPRRRRRALAPREFAHQRARVDLNAALRDDLCALLPSQSKLHIDTSRVRSARRHAPTLRGGAAARRRRQRRSALPVRRGRKRRRSRVSAGGLQARRALCARQRRQPRPGALDRLGDRGQPARALLHDRRQRGLHWDGAWPQTPGARARACT